MGVKDSKLLSPSARERLFGEIKKVVKDFRILVIPPEEIDAAVESEDGDNLNWLEAKKSAELINALKPGTAYLDCPSTNIAKYTAYVQNLVEAPAKLVAEHKADAKYPVVSAASILAKVTRDAEIEKIKEKIGIDFGSGYPSDPMTQAFLKKNYGKYPEIFRKSWASWKEAREKAGQTRLGSF